MPPQVQNRRGTFSSLAVANETPLAGEIYVETDTKRIKVGDGTTQYTALPYIGGANDFGGGSGANRLLNTLTFNGTTTTFSLVIGTTSVTPANAASLLISLNGVLQRPEQAYTVSGSQITFSVAPASTDTFFGVWLGGSTVTWTQFDLPSNVGNYTLPAGFSHLRYVPVGARNMHGIVAEPGRSVVLFNDGPHALTLPIQSASASAANRFIGTGSSIVVPAGTSVTIFYDTVTGSGGWRVIASDPASWWETSAPKTKLDAIAAGATANSTDAQLRDRATHTGTQPISTVTGLQDALNLKADSTSLATKANVSHTHAISDTVNLQATLDSKASSSHSHVIADISNLQDALDSKAILVSGKVPASQLPSYVDDVLEYGTFASLPASGEEGKIYITTSTAKIYRWGGTAYVEIVGSPGSTDSVPEGATNLYFTNARAQSALTSQLAGKASLTNGRVPLSQAPGEAWLSITLENDPLNFSLSTTHNQYRLSSGAARTIYGITASAGTSVRLHNVGSFNITLPAGSPLADAGNRFANAATITPAGSVQVAYDSSISAWRVLADPVVWWAASANSTKLAGIASGATANATNAQLRDRTTHTGTQGISTVDGLQAALDAKADTSHTHSSSSITDFAAAVASAAPVTSVNGMTGAVTVSGGSGYTLPVATSSVLGGVKQGSNVTIGGDGVISVAAPVTSLPYASITGTPTLAAIATSGSASDIVAGTVPFANLPVGTGSTSVAAGNDSRFTDQRTPTDGSVTDAKIVSSGLSAGSINWTAITNWAASTAYAKGDLVEYEGVAYRRSAAGTSGATFNIANWQQITPTSFPNARLSANVQQASDNLFHPFLLAGM